MYIKVILFSNREWINHNKLSLTPVLVQLNIFRGKYMIQQRINTASGDCWWTPCIYSGYWASFNILLTLPWWPFCVQNLNYWISTIHLESPLTFHILPAFCVLLKQGLSLSNSVDQVIFVGPHGLGFWEKYHPATHFGHLPWRILNLSYQKAVVTSRDAVLLSFPDSLWDTTQESIPDVLIPHDLSRILLAC